LPLAQLGEILFYWYEFLHDYNANLCKAVQLKGCP